MLTSHLSPAVSCRLKAAVVLLALGASSACAASSPAADGQDTPSTPASATAAASAAASASPVAASIPTEKPIEGKVIQSAKGPYVQARLRDDFDAFKYRPEIVDPAVLESYTPEEIASAQRFVVEFIASEGIDSKMNNAGQTGEEWFAEHKDLIAPEFQEELAGSLSGEKFFVVREDWQGPDFNYTYGENTTRVADLRIDPFQIFLSKSGGLAVNSNVAFDMKLDENSNNQSSRQSSTGTMGYSVRKDEASGGWLLTSFQHHIQTPIIAG